MKRRYKIIAALMFSIVTLVGCGKGGETETAGVEITAEMAEKYATLGDYEGIALTRYITEISEDDVAAKKDQFMENYKIQTEVADRNIEEGDFVSIEVTETEGSESEDYGTVEVTVGEEEFDAQIDAALIGHKAGETVTTESSYLGEDGKEVAVTYTITINKIYEITYPEYNDAFVKENTEYSTVAELEESFRAEVKSDNEEVSLDDLRESAIAAVVECSEFKKLPQKLIDSAYGEVKEMYENYAAMFGMELSDMASEEELQEAAEYSVQEQMIILSLINKEQIDVDEEGFAEYKKSCMEYAEVETEEELLEYYEEGELEEEYMRQKVADAIIAKAEVTEEEAPEEDYEEEDVTEEEAEVDTDVILEEEAGTEAESEEN